MNKKLLLLGIAGTMLSLGANAQLALENFNHGGAAPSGWTMINDGHTVSSSFTGSTAIQDSLDNNAWIPVRTTSSTTDYQMLTTSLFSPAAAANRWLISPSFLVSSPNTVLEWQDWDLSSGETLTVKVSPTAGTTAGSFTSTIFNSPAGVGGLVTHKAYIGGWNGSNVTVAFVDQTNNNWGVLIDNVQTTLAPSLDLSVTSASLPPFVQVGSSNTISGIIHNNGVVTTASMNLNYSVNGGAPVSTSLTGLNILFDNDYSYTSGTPWVPSTAGTYTIKVWADNINVGGIDEVHSNDTFTTTVIVADTLKPKTVLIEEFNQASCDPCAAVTPNLDSVYHNNLDKSIIVRYHVNFPGRDCMDSVTLAPFVSSRLSYYSVSGVPDAQVDGSYVYPGAGYFTSSTLATAASYNSPLAVTVTKTGYDASTQTYTFTAQITAYGPIPAGLKAYAALTIDTITYRANQSTESIPQTIFPEVAENMFPGPSGTTLSAFTSGSTQTITGSWVKNHPWGSNYSVWPYDSTATGKIVVWVQDNSNKYVYQAGYAPVNTVSTDVKNVTSNIEHVEIYPNPTRDMATLAMTLTQTTNVRVEVLDALGRTVNVAADQNMTAGQQKISINTASLPSGLYNVRVTTGNSTTVQKLNVIK